MKDISFNGHNLNSVDILIVPIGGAVKPESELTCDRCHNRSPGHLKIVPIRPETLCADCKHALELLEYITAES